MIDFFQYLCYYIIMKNNLGEIIQLNRENSGLSVRDLAKLSGINHTDVSKLEKNKIQKPSIRTLVSLSNVLNINLLAIYLEESERYLYYQPIIEMCSDLTKTQQDAVLEYIQQIKNGGTL